MVKIHKVKADEEHFKNVLEGKKTAEVRFNDRTYMKYDVIIMQEYCTNTKLYSGRDIMFIITDVALLDVFDCTGYVLLSFNHFVVCED